MENGEIRNQDLTGHPLKGDGICAQLSVNYVGHS